MITFSTQDKLDCAKRELHYRLRVYQRWVEDKRMSAESASRQIALMSAIVADYEKQLAAEQPQLNLCQSVEEEA